MIPTNSKSNGCTPTSSNCIIWQGPDIPFLNLCNGASITEVTYQLAIKVQEIMEILNIDSYEFTCLGLGKCGPVDMKDLIQLILTKLCYLLNKEEAEQLDIDDITVKLDDDNCFVELYDQNDPETGKKVVDIPIVYLSKMMAKILCSVRATVNQHTEDIADIQSDIDEIETDIATLQTSKMDKKEVNTFCFDSSKDLFTAFNTLGELMCGYINVLNTSDALLTAYKKQCVTSTDVMLSNELNFLNVTDPDKTTDLAQSISNVWATICDLRSAVKGLKNSLNIIPNISVSGTITCCLNAKVVFNKGSYDFIQPLDSKITFKQGSVYKEFIVASTEWSTSSSSLTKDYDLADRSFNKMQDIEIEFSYNFKNTTTNETGTVKCNGTINPVLASFSLSESNLSISISYDLNTAKYVRILRDDTQVYASTTTETGSHTQTEQVSSYSTKYTYKIQTKDQASDSWCLCTSAEITTSAAACNNPVIKYAQWLVTDGCNNVPPTSYETWFAEFNTQTSNNE